MRCIKRSNSGIINKTGSNTNNQLKNYPNPFIEFTTIELNLSKGGNACIDIYNSQGMLVCNLINTNLSKGEHKINWEGGKQCRSKAAYWYVFLPS